MKFKIALIFCCSLILSSCNPFSESPATKRVTIENNFWMDVPLALRESHELHDEAKLQMQNGLQELYLCVFTDDVVQIDSFFAADERLEDYADGLDGYTRLCRDDMTDAIEKYDITEITEASIGNYDARFFEMEADVDGLPIYYNYHVVEAGGRYYQILSWTLLERKSRHKEKMNNMAKSFHLH